MEKMAILEQIQELSPAEQRALFVDWMTQEGTAKRALAYLELGLDLKVIRYNRDILDRLLNGVWSYIETHGKTRTANMKRIKKLKAVFTKDMSLLPSDVALKHLRQARLPQMLYSGVLHDAQVAKKQARDWLDYHAYKGGEVRKYTRGANPPNGDEADSTPEPVNKSAKRGAQKTPKTVKEPVRVESLRPVVELQEAVRPYRGLIETLGSLKVVRLLIDKLEHNLHVPSLVLSGNGKAEPEMKTAKEFPEWFDVMRNTSLFDHSCYVLLEAIRLTENTLGETFLPMVITTALAHDTGKIPDVFEGSSSIRGHEHRSAGYLRRLFQGESNSKMLKPALAAILHHHAGPKDNDPVARILMQADAIARENAMAARNPAMVRKPIEQWLTPNDLARVILPSVNILDGRRHWQAMSFRGGIYCMYGYILKCVTSLAKEKGILDYRFVRQSKAENIEILREVIDILRGGDRLAREIYAGHYCRRFHLIVNNPNIPDKDLGLVPIRGDMFGVLPSELEARKTDYLKLIVDISPV